VSARELVSDWLPWLECAAMLRPLPGVAEAFEQDGRLWLRFTRDATTEERDHVTELLTGRKPRLRRFEVPRAEPERKQNHPQKTPRRGGNAA